MSEVERPSDYHRRLPYGDRVPADPLPSPRRQAPHSAEASNCTGRLLYRWPEIGGQRYNKQLADVAVAVGREDIGLGVRLVAGYDVVGPQ